ncbi:MarR family transcriptional regulator [Mobilitalea sibirica]|uniref:HTH-type transcriptional regulator SarZ n=1 Tax=Mobilitalea sibirica TaxID=1462919 RepID=A0A8J7GX05_9FIRM|nr:MarR family transcriptional regulator [Mobilitalea sibirica]MBH1939519.1 MarR family transcriptional regulator [Mobilitalea sibirica]
MKNQNHANKKVTENVQKISEYDILKLDNQLCFSLYVCSKEIIRKYKPLLDPYGLTYTGYIILLALWEKDDITVKDLGRKLYLDSGTLTPMLKKLEALDFIKRTRGSKDERTVYIKLTKKGYEFKEEAKHIPEKMVCSLELDPKHGKEMLVSLHKMMDTFSSTELGE